MSERFIFEPPARTGLTVSGSDLLFPVHRVYCVGRNYAAHAREMGDSGRQPPFFFMKPPDAVTQSSSVPYPPATSMLHHEVELVVAIGRGGRNIRSERALDHVFGYAVGVDLTRRDLQARAKEKGWPWAAGKGFDHSAPVSELLPAAQAGCPRDARIRLSIDGELRQDGRTADMIWPVPEVIAELSRYFLLMPGDLVFTGTPEGVGPLAPGSEVSCEIEGLAAHRFTMGMMGKP